MDNANSVKNKEIKVIFNTKKNMKIIIILLTFICFTACSSSVVEVKETYFYTPYLQMSTTMYKNNNVIQYTEEQPFYLGRYNDSMDCYYKITIYINDFNESNQYFEIMDNWGDKHFKRELKLLEIVKFKR